MFHGREVPARFLLYRISIGVLHTRSGEIDNGRNCQIILLKNITGCEGYHKISNVIKVKMTIKINLSTNRRNIIYKYNKCDCKNNMRDKMRKINHFRKKQFYII